LIVLPLISAGELFEWLRPVAYALAAILSAWVLASARRHRFPFYVVAAWTIGTLLFAPIFLPLYLIARAARRRREREPLEQPGQNDESRTLKREEAAPLAGRRVLPLAYLMLVLAVYALQFYLDYQSVDAHLARANQSRLMGQHEKTIREYRAALKLQDDPHTHNLLGIELAGRERWTEALAEFRAAERGGEPDDALAFRIASTLDALKRPAEATVEYRKFLSGPACMQVPPDARCETALARVRQATGS